MSLTLETDKIGDIVLIAKMQTNVYWTNQVYGAACIHPQAEGLPVLSSQKEILPDIFMPHKTLNDKPLPKEYKKLIETAIFDVFPDIEDFQCTGTLAPKSADEWPGDMENYDMEAWVQCRFKLKTDYNKSITDWIDGVLTWMNSD